ncbi:Type II secretion system protein GspF domain containing protein [Acidimicrobiia bacterium]
MNRLPIFIVLLVSCGSWLLLREMRWFRRVGLTDRLRPYLAGGSTSPSTPIDRSMASFTSALTPSIQAIGDRVASLFGSTESLGRQLERVHSPLSPAAFRLRQIGWCVIGFALGSLVAVSVRPPALFTMLLVVGAPTIIFLLLELELTHQSTKWRRQITLELPVVSEQLAMLLSSGFSLGAGLNRLSTRSSGTIARDLRRVVNRIQQGLDETQALREWSDLANVPALDRLISVLAMNRAASDLGRLITDEARVCRADVHRELIERIERRGQQVWIPVTVATLVPGVLFLAVPFAQALQIFASG